MAETKELRQVEFTLDAEYRTSQGARCHTRVKYLGLFHAWGLSTLGTNREEDDTNFSVAVIEILHPVIPPEDKEFPIKQNGEVILLSPEEIKFIS